MADILNDMLFLRANVNSTTSDREGAFNTTGAFYIPIFTDGLKAGETITAKAIDTEHKDPGVKYKILTSRNAAEGTLETPIFPENVAFLFAATLTKTNGLPSYHGLESYWNGTLGTGTASFGGAGGTGEVDTGRALLGVLFNGFTISVDRTNIEEIRMQNRIFVNREVPITAAAPTPTFPAQDPYTTGNLYIDLQLGNDSGTIPAYQGDATNLVNLSLNYSNNLSVSFHTNNTTAEKHLTWTRAYRKAPTLEITGSFIMANTDYVRLTRLGTLRKGKIKVMGHGSSPSGSTTCSASLASGATSVTVASATGLAVNDYIILAQSSTNKICVTKVTAIATNTLTVSPALPFAIDGTASAITVKNTAWQLEVPLFDVEAKEPPASGGDYKQVSFSGTARLASGQTDLCVVSAYNDDNT